MLGDTPVISESPFGDGVIIEKTVLFALGAVVTGGGAGFEKRPMLQSAA